MGYTLIEIVTMGDDDAREVVARYKLDEPVAQIMVRPSVRSFEPVSDMPSMARCPWCWAVVWAEDIDYHRLWHEDHVEA